MTSDDEERQAFESREDDPRRHLLREFRLGRDTDSRELLNEPLSDVAAEIADGLLGAGDRLSRAELPRAERDDGARVYFPLFFSRNAVIRFSLSALSNSTACAICSTTKPAS